MKPMRKPHVRTAAGFFFSLFLAVTSVTVSAHEDPRGEVHPTVVAREETFEVYFRDNREETSNSYGKPYRSVFNLDGSELVHREPYDEKGADDDRSPTTLGVMMLDIGEDGLPFFRLRPNDGVGEQTHRFPLPKADFIDCAILSWHSRFEMVVRFSPAGRKADDAWPFSVGIFDLRNDKLVSTAHIGNAGRIYDFAVTSPALVKDGEYYVAWIETKLLKRDKVTTNDGGTAEVVRQIHRVILSRWSPTTKNVLYFEVDRALSDNAALSIATKGDNLMVAWHDMGKVRTRVVNLSKDTFTSELPPLEYDKAAEEKLLRGLGFPNSFFK